MKIGMTLPALLALLPVLGLVALLPELRRVPEPA
jgi:hypothetical protein